MYIKSRINHNQVNSIGGVMVSGLSLNAVDYGFVTLSSKPKTMK